MPMMEAPLRIYVIGGVGRRAVVIWHQVYDMRNKVDYFLINSE